MRNILIFLLIQAGMISCEPMPALAALSASAMKAKIRAAYSARTGKNLNDDANNILIDICTGIVQEIQADAELNNAFALSGIPVSTPAGPGNTSANGPVTGGVH